MNYLSIKNLLLSVLLIPTLFLILKLFYSFSEQPLIKDISLPDMKNLAFDNRIESEETSNEMPSTTFDYKVIGYSSGPDYESVILKKGNKEYVLSKGEKIEGKFELVEVGVDEIIFRNNDKLYKIKNLVGK